MKKSVRNIISAVLCSTLILSLAACGGEKKETKGADAGAETMAAAADREASPNGETKAEEGTEAAAGTEAASGEKFKVLYVSRNQADTFAARLSGDFVKYWEANYQDQFEFDVQDAQADPDKENQLIEQGITAGYDGIIVQPNDSDAQTPYVKQAADAGVKVITTNAGIRDIEGASWIDADPYEQGRVIAELAVKQAPENAKVAIMSCNPGNLHTESRLQAYKDIFVAQRTDCEIVAEKICTQSDQATFMQTMEDWVQAYGKIDVVLTIGDDLAKACYEVVKDDPTFADTQYYAVDANPDALLRIKAGNQDATVMQDTQELAQKNLDAMYDLMTGKQEKVEETIETILITPENVDEYIEKYIEIGIITQEEYDAVK